MVRDPAIEPEPAKPPVSEVQMDLVAKPPLGPDAGQIADQQHPDAQLGIDRGSPEVAVKRSKLSADVPQLEEPLDPP